MIFINQLEIKGHHTNNNRNRKQIRFQEEEDSKSENHKDIELEELQQNRNTRMRNNMLDIIVYIITGIFLIFILDLFVRLGKNARS